MFELTPPWQQVLDYWFDDGLALGWPSRTETTRKWFRASAGDDAEISHRFGALVEAALCQELVDWERQPESRLALILLLDQFPRHIYRGQAQAFAGDHRAATLAVEGLSRRMAASLPWCGQVFFCMPLMHVEDADLQQLCVEQMEAIARQAPASCADQIAGHVQAAQQHLAVIQRFGRFPHRNRVLQRESSPEEQAFLETVSGFGQ